MPVEKPDETPKKSLITLLGGFLEYIMEVPKGLSALPLPKYLKQMIAGLWLPGILLLYFGFQEIWDVLWGKYLVEPIWSKFEKGWGSFFLVLILLSGVLLKSKPWNILQKGYGLGPQLAGLMWSVLIVLLHNRFSGSWHFFSMPFGEVIRYFDLLWASLGMLLVLDAGIFCMRKPLENSDEGFLHGLPINPEEDKDELEYEPLAASIARMLNRSLRPDSAFAMGVTGRYGDGKTSFINLMRQHLEAHEVIDFCPWLYSDKQALNQGYFYELRQALSRYDAALSNELEDYAQILASGKLPYFSGLARQVQTALQLRRRKPSFEVINHKLRELGIKLVVIIDDLDRLTPDEVIEVIRIIRSSGAFANTVFIAAYDKNHIAKALKDKLSEERGEVFLEKVFQFEVTLPQKGSRFIVDKLLDHFKSFMKKEHSEKIIDSLSEIKTSSLYGEEKVFRASRFIYNLRDVNRFLNSWKITYNELGINEEVDIANLFYIELLRFKYRTIYDKLLFEKEHYLVMNRYVYLPFR